MTHSDSSFFTNLTDLQEELGRDDLISLDNKAAQDDARWFSEDFEGELSVDVYQTDKNVMVKSTIAGVKPEDLEIFIHDDLLTIRGKREEQEEIKKKDYFYKECYWGGFSRSIILPVEVVPDKIKADLKNGVLTITLPKAKKSQVINVQVKGD